LPKKISNGGHCKKKKKKGRHDREDEEIGGVSGKNIKKCPSRNRGGRRRCIGGPDEGGKAPREGARFHPSLVAGEKKNSTRRSVGPIRKKQVPRER